jgi:hypothetical protein
VPALTVADQIAEAIAKKAAMDARLAATGT